MLRIHYYKYWETSLQKGWLCKNYLILALSVNSVEKTHLMCSLPVIYYNSNAFNTTLGVNDLDYIVYMAHKFGILCGYYTKYCDPNEVWGIFTRAIHKN